MAECPSEHNKREKLQEIGSQLDRFDYVRITVCDIHGISRGKLIPARNAIKYLKKGMGAFAGNGKTLPFFHTTSTGYDKIVELSK